MKRYNYAFVIFIFVFQYFNLFADIAPVQIKAKTIYPGNKTSVRMESERVIIDLYNDSSVIKCFFKMKNLGEQEKLHIGFPEMNFYHYRLISESEKLRKFQVKENGKAVKFYLSDSLKNNEEFRNKVDNYQIIHDWYLWEGEFLKGESKTIEVQYSLPYGALYKSNKRFFTYLLSTGANWKGTIGKAEIIVNLKDIEMDSVVSQQPNNCVTSNNQLTWTFLDFEPTTNDDIKIYYNSNKILHTGNKPIRPVFVINGKLEMEIDLDKLNPNDIASIEVIKNPEEIRKYTNQNNGVIKIYTKDYVQRNSSPSFAKGQDNVLKSEACDTSLTHWTVQVLPEYQGGNEKLLRDLNADLKLEKHLSGACKVDFLVNCKGKTSGYKLRSDFDNEFEKKFTRTFSGLQNWKPGKYNNENVDCSYTLTFRIDKGIIKKHE